MSGIKVVSEVAGSVWKVLVAVGDKVEPGAPILLIESMKMEIPVLAPEAGVVIEILVAVGDLIAEGQAVATIKTSA
jgi:acetyl-CoA carboxylase biotin carboxyl carrier protein